MRAMLFALVACGGTASPPPPKPVAVAIQPVVVVPPCITPPEETSTIARATADGTRVAFCVAPSPDSRRAGCEQQACAPAPSPDSRRAGCEQQACAPAIDTQCFALDVEAGKLERLAEPPKAPVTEARVETVDAKLEVCTGDTCKQLTPKVLPNATHMRAATNSDGTYAVFLLGDAAKGKGYAEVWDVANTKRTAVFRYGAGEFLCGEVAMLGAKTIYVSATQCGQPAARAALYRLNGSKIANVGGKDFGTYGSRFVQVSGATWAFLEENANQLVIQDIAKGKLIKTIDVTPLFKTGGAEMSNPGESALVRLGDGRLAVIAGAPATGTIGVIDPTAGSLTIMPAPICK